MQEEVTGKSVALIVDGARMSEQVLEKAINAYLDARKNIFHTGACTFGMWWHTCQSGKGLPFCFLFP